MEFDPNIWGPHYWFFMMTLAMSYPKTPNTITKRKYYDLISNMPLFIPNEKIGNEFSKILDKYPVSPYLDNKDSFIRWVIFIHNKINSIVGKEEITIFKAIDNYKDNYRPKMLIVYDKTDFRKRIIYSVYILLFIILIYLFYK